MLSDGELHINGRGTSMGIDWPSTFCDWCALVLPTDLAVLVCGDSNYWK